MRISVVGTGYVGLVTGTCLADMGNTVTCHDIDEDKITRLQRGQIPIYEPGLTELVQSNLAGGRLHFTTDLSRALHESEVCFIAVGTPPAEDGSADLRHVLAVAGAIAKAMQGPLVVAVKSTVPVGTCDKVRELIALTLSERGVAHDFDVVSNPEFLKEGMAVEDFMRPDRIVLGAGSERGAEVMRRLYKPFIRNGHPFLVMDVRSSEMTKYASNVMLATRISLINELARICEGVGADVAAVRQGMGADKRIGMAFLYAGLGYGGSCFPKDVQALARLAREHVVDAKILDAVEHVNARQKALLAERITQHFGGAVHGKRIALWGIAFKPKTDDIREAPALTIISELTRQGAEVVAYDPEAMANARRHFDGNARLSFAQDHYAALEGAHALALVTEWGLFRNPDFERMRALLAEPVIFDGRNQYEPSEMKRYGFTYYCIGRPTR